MKTPQKRTKNESIGDEQQNILCAFLINIIFYHILFIAQPTRSCDFTVIFGKLVVLFFIQD